MKKILLLFVILFCTVMPSFARDYTIFEEPEGVYVIKIDTDKVKTRLRPFVSEGLDTNEEVYKNTNAKLVVNAGFFDPKNKKTVSYVVVNGKEVATPKDNENLMQNKALEPYMDKILNRSEFRIIEDKKGRLSYDIAPHSEKIPEGFEIKHSIQAGPMLVPDLRLEEEFFVLVKDGKIVSESASCLHKYARTAIGIKDNNVYLFIATTKAPMTLAQLSELAKKWGMEKAMGFDGGGSTSFDSKGLHIVSDKDNQARKLKSFLIVK